MRSDAELSALRDILRNIDLAERFTREHTFESFERDELHLYAVTRCLEIISEASRRLSPEMKARHPEIPWRKVSGSGNIYRHNYEDVAHRLVWGTVHEFLPALRLMAKNELAAEG
jgi:uncharacterized protein with HEPN domain